MSTIRIEMRIIIRIRVRVSVRISTRIRTKVRIRVRISPCYPWQSYFFAGIGSKAKGLFYLAQSNSHTFLGLFASTEKHLGAVSL